MQSFKPLWAVRPDFLMPMHQAFATGYEPDPTTEENTIARQKKMALFDALPKEVRAWIHENGTCNIARKWCEGVRNPKALIRAAERWQELNKLRHSVCLNNPVAEAEKFLDDLGL